MAIKSLLELVLHLVRGSIFSKFQYKCKRYLVSEIIETYALLKVSLKVSLKFLMFGNGKNASPVATKIGP